MTQKSSRVIRSMIRSKRVKRNRIQISAQRAMLTVFISGMILKWGKYGLCPGILREKRDGMKMEGGSSQNHKNRNKSGK